MINHELEYLWAIFNRMSEGVLILDLASEKTLFRNESFLKMWGLAPFADQGADNETLLKIAFHKLEHPEQVLRVMDELQKMPESSHNEIIELKGKIFLERRAEPFKVAGKTIGRIFFFRDITNEKTFTEKLIDQKNLLEAIFTCLPHSIFWKDHDLNYVGANKLFLKDAGLENLEDLIGKSDFEMPWGEAEAESFRAFDRQVLDSGESVFNLEETQLHKDGVTINVMTSKVPLKDSKGTIIGLLGIYSDVTELKKNYKLIKDQELLLVNASQMSSLGEMAAGIAHEINNPLSIIKVLNKTIAKLVTKTTFKPSDVSDQLSEMDKTVDRIAKIIIGLRNLSRHTDTELRPTTFGEILEDVLSVASERFKYNGISIRQKYDPMILKKSFLGNRIQLSQVVINLLNNSFDALKVVKSSDRWIEVGLSHTEDRIIFHLKDSGQGIPKDIREKMFRPFFTTKDIGKGTGIGLSISKSMIENFGGKLYYDESSPNTTFVLELPL